MKSCILPISIDVEIKAYQFTAFPLSVIKANISDYDIWLCNKFVRCSTISSVPCVCEKDIWSYDEKMTSTQTIYLYPSNFKDSGIDLIELCRAMLKKKCYITGCYNEYFIKGKHAYGRYDCSHDFLIFGFDDSKKVFKSVGYLEGGTYSVFDIGYDCFCKSMIQNNVDMTVLWFHHIREDYLAHINIAHIKEELLEYLELGQTIDEKLPQKRDEIEHWNKFSEYVLKIDNNELDLRLGRLYMEQKMVMSKRLYKLYELKYIDDRSLCEKYHENVCVKGSIVYYLFMKYNLKSNNTYLHRIADSIKIIAEEEKRLLMAVIQQLSCV